MGAGKTTATEWLAGYQEDSGVRRAGVIERAGARAMLITEGGLPRVSLTLPHPNAIWEDMTPEEFIARSLDLWRRQVAVSGAPRVVTVCDGLLFHGNLTDLLLMDAPPERLRAYVTEVCATLAPLRPCLIYLRYSDLQTALRAIFAERGPAWEAYQTNWKLSSPHARRFGLSGFEGFAALYEEYRALCDALVASLGMPHLTIERDGDWSRIYAEIAQFLDLAG